MAFAQNKKIIIEIMNEIAKKMHLLAITKLKAICDPPREKVHRKLFMTSFKM